ncbi:MAG: hypothetical protein AABY07_11225 [Nanoarchaeota archaeon]
MERNTKVGIVIMLFLIIIFYNQNSRYIGDYHVPQFRGYNGEKNYQIPILNQPQAQIVAPNYVVTLPAQASVCDVPKIAGGSSNTCPIPPCGFMSCQDCQDAVDLINSIPGGRRMDKKKVCKDSNGVYCGNPGNGNPVPVTNGQESLQAAAVAAALVNADGYCIEVNNKCVDDRGSDKLEITPTSGGFSATITGKCKES